MPRVCARIRSCECGCHCVCVLERGRYTRVCVWVSVHARVRVPARCACARACAHPRLCAILRMCAGIGRVNTCVCIGESACMRVCAAVCVYAFMCVCERVPVHSHVRQRRCACVCFLRSLERVCARVYWRACACAWLCVGVCLCLYACVSVGECAHGPGCGGESERPREFVQTGQRAFQRAGVCVRLCARAWVCLCERAGVYVCDRTCVCASPSAYVRTCVRVAEDVMVCLLTFMCARVRVNVTALVSALSARSTNT